MKFSVVLIAFLFLAGCVGPEVVKRQTIVLRTPHVVDAKCILTDKRGTKWRVKKTPHVVTVRAGNPPLNVICQKKGYKKTITTVEAEKVDFENYPGFIEEISGFVQDPFSQIASKYPDEILIWMEPNRWESDEKMRQWVYEKDLYEKQQEAIRLAKEEEKRRLRELEIELRAKSEDRLRQQRMRLYNSKWFQWLKGEETSRRERVINDIEERIETDNSDPQASPDEPINWRSRGLRQTTPEANKPKLYQFWKQDWFKRSKDGLTTYPNSTQ